LVDTQRNFGRIEILDDGMRVRVQPGITVWAVNARVARYGRRLGPDPDSEFDCTVGEVVAQKLSGMACGTELNTNRTLESAVVTMPGGTVPGTGALDADQRLRALEPEGPAGLARLRKPRPRELGVGRADPAAARAQEHHGLRVHSFVDHNRPG
jgi:D-lactate dehydrogenase